MIELETVLGQLVSLASGEDTRRMPALKLDEMQGPGELRRGVGPHVPGIHGRWRRDWPGRHRRVARAAWRVGPVRVY